MLNTLFSSQNRSRGKAYGWKATYVVNSFQSINQGTSRLSSSSSKKDQPPIITEAFSPSVRSQLPQILGEHWNTTYRIKETNKASCPQLLEVRECHLCEKGNKSKLDNLWKLRIFPSGSFHCFRCSEKGKWVKFLEKCGIPHHPPSTIKELSETKSGEQVPLKEEPQTQASPTSSPPLNTEKENKSSDAAVPKPITPLLSVLPKESSEKSFNLPHQLFYHQCFSNLFPAKEEPTRSNLAEKLVKDREIVKQYLHEIRKLNDIVLRKYLVGFTTQSFFNDSNEWIDHLCITFPWIIPQSHLNEAELNWPDLSNNMKGGIDPKTGKERKRITLSEEEILKENERQKAPLVFENNEVLNYYVRMKYRSLQTKGLQRILPKGGMWGFFGWHTVNPEKHKSIIITEGEYDCMAVSQVIHDPLLTENALFRDVPVVSLPNGCNSLPPELIERLIPFEKIYLWLDYDKSGQDAADKFSRKLGVHRCVIVTPPLDMKNPPKDANDALRQDPNLILRMLSTSKGVSHKRIEALSKFRKSILATMTDQPDGDAGQKSRRLIDEGTKTPLLPAKSRLLINEGTKTPSLPALTEKITGFRRGELVILSGPTGSGKTTLLSQLSLDFAQAGKPTLWGSFEVKNQNLVLKMFQQFRRSPVPIQNVPVETLEKIYDDFEALPIDFLNFYDYVSVDEILETMNFSVERDDIQHLIIDNLQFLLTQSLSAEPRESSDSEYFEEQVSLPVAPKKRGKQPVSAFLQEQLERQDELLERFRKFASEKNVNVIIVIHPRKEEDDVPLKLSSIGGTAKATQEADLVLILQKLERGKYLEVKKNRYNGKLGRIRLYYDERMNLYSSPLIKSLPRSTPPAALLPSFLTSSKTIKPKRAQFQPKDMSEHDSQQRESDDSSPKPETTVNAEIPSNRGGRKRKMDTVSNLSLKKKISDLENTIKEMSETQVNFSSKVRIDITKRPSFLRCIFNLPERGLETPFDLMQLKLQLLEGEDTGEYFHQFLPYILEEVRCKISSEKNIIDKKNRPAFLIYSIPKSKEKTVEKGIMQLTFRTYESNLPKLDHGFFNEVVFIQLPNKHANKQPKSISYILAIAKKSNSKDREDNGESEVKITLTFPESDYQFFKNESELRLHWLCGLTTAERMFEACMLMPSVEFQNQYLYGRLPQWEELPAEMLTQKVSSESANLNSVQRSVVDRLQLVSSGLRLVVGPPGTGKTKTAVQFFIDYARKHPENRILICAPSNQAVHVLVTEALKFLDSNSIALTGTAANIADGLQEVFVQKYPDSLVNPLIAAKRQLERNSNALDLVIARLTHLQQRINDLQSETAMYIKDEVRKPIKTLTQQLSNKIELFSKSRQAVQKGADGNDYDFIEDLEEIIQLVKENDYFLESFRLQRSQIVFASLVSSGRKWLEKQVSSFSMVLLDEAAQALVPEALIPLKFHPKLYVQFGDPKQLPATVTSREARTLGYENSMMHWLINGLSQPHEILTIQYRMEEKICSWISHQYYDHQLQSAPEVIQRRSIIHEHRSLPRFLQKPSLFIDIDGEENKHGDSDFNMSSCNLKEAKAVMDMAYYLIQTCRFDPKQIGIITFYSEQVNTLKRLRDQLFVRKNGPEIRTVDGFQGGEKDIILISAVRTITSVGFLNDSRRINVAMSRAKYARWVFGNLDPLSKSNSDFRSLLHESSKSKWVDVIHEKQLREAKII